MRFCHSFRSGIPLFRAGHQRVTHPFATNVLLHPFDLHVLGTPPAFILSQDQTLRCISHSFKLFSLLFPLPESFWFVSSFSAASQLSRFYFHTPRLQAAKFNYMHFLTPVNPHFEGI
jgi:hypothetical protein